MKFKARSTALASAVKIDESSGLCCILLWLSDKTEQSTFESSFDSSHKFFGNYYNDFAAF